MKSPVEQFLSWYNQLPLIHQQAIGWMSSLHHTDFEGTKQANREAIPMLFRSIFIGYERESERLRAYGALISLNSHVDKFFIREHGYQTVLEEIQNILRQSHGEEQAEELTEIAEILLSEDDSEETDWQAIVTKWQVLKNKFLSEAYLKQWIKAPDDQFAKVLIKVNVAYPASFLETISLQSIERRNQGESGFYSGADHETPNNVWVIFNWESTVSAKKFWNSMDGKSHISSWRSVLIPEITILQCGSSPL